MYTVSQKNIHNILSSNSNKRYPTFKIFGTNITERLSNQKLVYFSTSPKYSVSALPGKHINIFSLKWGIAFKDFCQ